MTRRIPRGRRTGLFALVALALLGLGSTAVRADDDPPAEPAPATETAEVPWVRDYAEAKKLAKKEGKDLLINFTGSDWCPYCMRLDEEVFSQVAFLTPASKKYVFVFMDTPRDPSLEKEVADPKLRDRLKDEMLVGGYPTVILATADGAPFARTGYQRGGAEDYVRHMAELEADGERVKKLLADTSTKDTAVLKAGLEALARHMLLGYPAYGSLLEAAERADADGSLGLAALVKTERARQRAADEEKSLAAALPKAEDEEFDWPKIGEALLETKYLTGLDFMRLVFASANHMIEVEKDGAKAKALLELAKRDPLLEDHARAKEIWAEMLESAEELLAAKEEPPEKDDGDGR